MFEEEYDDYDSIPAAVKHLYKEVDGKYVLIKAGEIKTAQDVTNVQEGLRKEREDHKETKRKLAKFNNLDPDEVLEKLDRIEELEAAASGSMDEEKINKIVESRIKSKTAPLERELNQVKVERDELKGQVTDFQVKDVRRTIRDDVRKAATTAKVRDTALEDVLLISENLFERDEAGKVVTKDGVGVTPGISAEVWLTEAKNTRPHWWPESQGTGARGGDGGAGGSNPFTNENWNLTEQGRIQRENPDKAAQLAKAAGTSVGGGRPQKK
jgi:hypothetical protein